MGSDPLGRSVGLGGATVIVTVVIKIAQHLWSPWIPKGHLSPGGSGTDRWGQRDLEWWECCGGGDVSIGVTALLCCVTSASLCVIGIC